MLSISLKYIFVAGEFCDHETKIWAEKAFKVPILNNWWQSETGHPITALCLGYGQQPSLPKNSTGLPVPGYDSKSFKVTRHLAIKTMQFYYSDCILSRRSAGGR